MQMPVVKFKVNARFVSGEHERFMKRLREEDEEILLLLD